LWQNFSGQAAVWLIGSDGVTPIQQGGVGTNPGHAWHIMGAGDFNGDGRADILWQNDNGQPGVWLIGSDGVTPIQQGGVGTNPGPAWHIMGAGDFNGDGRADILWQNDNSPAGVWLMGSDGMTPAQQPGTTWHIIDL
jgi:serralysin